MVNIDGIPVITRLLVQCDNCPSEFQRTVKLIKKSRRKFNKDLCSSCASKLTVDKKPQCSKNFWTQDKKLEHGKALKENENFKTGIEKREQNGNKNHMFGKTHSASTKSKMSKARTGKIGENATAWKGGRSSLVRRVKGFQYRNGWYLRVYKRDGFKCVECSSIKKIEVHHLKPVKTIVDEIRQQFNNDDDAYLFLTQQDIILDPELTNGKTLCRKCHIAAHANMGSHNPIVNE